MNGFWKVVNKVISDADILVEVLDARLVEETRNIEIEAKVKKSGKPLVYAINKSDLVDTSELLKYKKSLGSCVFLSSTKKEGTLKLKEMILSKSGNLDLVKVGILGYPNVGKSSIINALCGTGKVRTSCQSGFTKGKQDIRITERLRVIDTPGVIPFREKDDLKHTLISTIDYAHAKEPDTIVFELMTKYPGMIEKYYDVSESDDFDSVIEEIAIKLSKVKKGNTADIDVVSRIILKAWQEGKIRK